VAKWGTYYGIDIIGWPWPPWLRPWWWCSN